MRIIIYLNDLFLFSTLLPIEGYLVMIYTVQTYGHGMGELLIFFLQEKMVLTSSQLAGYKLCPAS